MKKRNFGYKFWKDIAEVSSYAFLALSLAGDMLFARRYLVTLGLIVIGACIIMMVIEEYKDRD